MTTTVPLPTLIFRALIRHGDVRGSAQYLAALVREQQPSADPDDLAAEFDGLARVCSAAARQLRPAQQEPDHGMEPLFLTDDYRADRRLPGSLI